MAPENQESTMDRNQQVARSERLFTLVSEGKTVFFKADGAWLIIGPAADVKAGQRVTVTKADSETTEVIVGRIMASGVKRGVEYCSAQFSNVPEVQQPQQDRVYQVVDRSAAMVGGMLGRSSSTPLGYCHYCGLPLNRNGYCEECV